MEVIVRTETARIKTDFPVEELVTSCVQEALHYHERHGGEGGLPPCLWHPRRIEEIEGEVSVTLTDNAAIQRLNAAYRGKDVPTDVLSFPMDPDWSTGYVLLGDVVISLEKAVEQAQAYGHSLAREVGFLTVHGVLHLLGYDHEKPEEAAVMEAVQREVLAELALVR